MATTTVRMNDELKARVAAAATRADKTAHAFILDAITQTVERAEHADVLRAQGASEQALQDLVELSEELGLEF